MSEDEPAPVEEEPTDELSAIPPSLHDTVIQTQARLAAQGLDCHATVPAQGLEFQEPSEISRSQRIPIELLGRSGRQVDFSKAGTLEDGPPVEDPQYEVLDVLGVGGMGVVCTARQEALHREVALKVAWEGVGKPGQTLRDNLELFINEAVVTANLDHPNVVPVYALARDEAGRLFYTMKRVAGVSWKHLLDSDLIEDPDRRAAAERRKASMSFDDHIEVLLKVADAVAFAHARGYLHRDLKPVNVMLGDFGEVFVMDWGLAIEFGERNPYVRDPSRPDQLVGTPCFMAPEMARGEMRRLGPATDIYLLGGILYQLLTGRAPHRSSQIIKSINLAAAGRVDPPEKVVRGKRVDLNLSRIAMKALAPRIEDRYQDVRSFREELRHFRAHADSLAGTARAEEIMQEVRRSIAAPEAADVKIGDVGPEAAMLAYGKLSECSGAFRQALDVWPGNRRAFQGLLSAHTLSVELALHQGDSTLARYHLEELQKLARTEPPQAERSDTQIIKGRPVKKAEEHRRDLEARVQDMDRREEVARRRARRHRWLVMTVIALLLGLVGGFIYLLNLQKNLALAQLRASQVQTDLSTNPYDRKFGPREPTPP